MGQKVNPHGLRVGVIKDWDSKWYADGDFADYLVEDYNIRTFLKKKLYAAGVSKIEIERASDRVKVIIYTAKPGVVIGKGGAEIEKIKWGIQEVRIQICQSTIKYFWHSLMQSRRLQTKVRVFLWDAVQIMLWSLIQM